MTEIKRTIRFLVSITILEIVLVALIVALLATYAPDKAAAHTMRPGICTNIWEAAPPGEKWAAKQRCLRIVARHNCVLHPRPVPAYVRVKGDRAGTNQRHVIRWIVSEGLRRGLSRKIVLSALAATTQEASARELRYGHGTSLGPFQLIDDHGPASARITVEFSGNWYFNGAVKELRRMPYLSAAGLAQEVEESAHPSAYGQWIAESNRTLAAVLGPCRLR